MRGWFNDLQAQSKLHVESQKMHVIPAEERALG